MSKLRNLRPKAYNLRCHQPVLERFGVIAVIAFGMLAIFEIRIRALCESSQELLPLPHLHAAASLLSASFFNRIIGTATT
jgi:hypothetical protein